jgi:hypothetical protein
MLSKLKEKYHQHKLHRAQKKEAHQQMLHEIKNTPTAYDNAVFSWIAPEYVMHDRGLTWKISMIALVVAVSALSLYFEEFLLATVVVVFAAVYALIHLQHPRNVEIKISEVGIKVGFKKYTFSRIKAFWFIYEPPFVETLNLRVDGSFSGEITIQLAGMDPSLVREFLINKIPELEGKTESFPDILIRLFKI